MSVEGPSRKQHRTIVARFDVHHHVDRQTRRRHRQCAVVIIAHFRIGKPGLGDFGMRLGQLRCLNSRNPARGDKIGLERVDRRPQRLQHVGLDDAWRAKQSGGDPAEQFAFGEAVLYQAGMDVDRARQRDPFDRHFLLVHAVRRGAGQRQPDDRQQSDDEAKPNQRASSIMTAPVDAGAARRQVAQAGCGRVGSAPASRCSNKYQALMAFGAKPPFASIKPMMRSRP